MNRPRTRIVATLGPSTDDGDVFVRIVEAGVDVARLNLSHGTRPEHVARIERARAMENGPAVMLDTRGPETRVDLEGYGLMERGQALDLPFGRFNPSSLPRALMPGDVLYLGDGQLDLQVEEIEEDRLRAIAKTGGRLAGSMRVTPPPRVEAEISRDQSALTEKDRDDLSHLLPLGVEFVALSMVRSVEDVLEIRSFMEERDLDAQVIVKIETPAAVEAIETILAVSDGLMVARGDLGLRLPVEEVPHLQKKLIRIANRVGKPVITATQMLESMVSSPAPTRAEASDVANAILDGTDAVMLSAESAVGSYPLEAVRTMAKIALRAEVDLPERSLEWGSGSTITDVLGQSACQAARFLGASAIISATRSGYTARMVARARPRVPIVAVTPSTEVARRLSLTWGVVPLVVTSHSTTDEVLTEAISAALDTGTVSPGDLVVLTAGLPPGVPGTTNILKVDVAAEVLARGVGIGEGIVAARAFVPEEGASPPSEEYVVVVDASTPDMVPLVSGASGLIAQQGGLTSHAAILGLHLGLPTIVGATGVLDRVKPGQVVTMDSYRGLVFGGRVQIPGDPDGRGRGTGC